MWFLGDFNLSVRHDIGVKIHLQTVWTTNMCRCGKSNAERSRRNSFICSGHAVSLMFDKNLFDFSLQYAVKTIIQLASNLI